MVTLPQVKQAIGKYINQEKPEPNLVLQLGDSVDIEVIDWLKQAGAKQESEFWVISREDAKKAITPTSFDWDTHWKKEKEYRENMMKEAMGV
jgi:hypothetical protein